MSNMAKVCIGIMIIVIGSIMYGGLKGSKKPTAPTPSVVQFETGTEVKTTDEPYPTTAAATPATSTADYEREAAKALDEMDAETLAKRKGSTPPRDDWDAVTDWFWHVEGDEKSQVPAERAEHKRRRTELMAAFNLKLRQNPYRQNWGDSTYPPSNSLRKYQEIIPGALLLRALLPEMRDYQKTLRREGGDSLSQTRAVLREIQDDWYLTRAQWLTLGFTGQELLEAEIDFTKKRDDEN